MNKTTMFKQVRDKIRREGLLAFAVADSGDYWDSIELDGVTYDINIYDNGFEPGDKQIKWTVSLYPLKPSDDGYYYERDTQHPVFEGKRVEIWKL